MSITPMKPSYDPAPEFLREPAPQDESLSYPGDVEEQPFKWRTGEDKPETGKDSKMRFMLIAGIVLAGLLIFLAGMFTGAAIVTPAPVDERSSTTGVGAATDSGTGKSETLMAPRKTPPVSTAPAASVPAAPKPSSAGKSAVVPPAPDTAPEAAAVAPPAPPAAAVIAPPPVAAAPAPESAAPPPPPAASLFPPKPPVQSAAEASPAAKAPAADADAPPAPPLEQLARDLEGQGETTPKALAKPAPPPVAAAFSVQVGAFSSKVNADRLVARFGKQGIEAFVVRGTDSRNRTLYYVRSGSFDGREKARLEADKIKKIAGTPAIVVAPGKGDVRL